MQNPYDKSWQSLTGFAIEGTIPATGPAEPAHAGFVMLIRFSIR